MSKSLLGMALEDYLAEHDKNDMQETSEIVTEVVQQAELNDECEEELENTISAIVSMEELVAAIEPVDGKLLEESKTAEKILAVAVENIFVKLGQPLPVSLGMEDDSEDPDAVKVEAGSLNSKVQALKDFIIRLIQKVIENFSAIYGYISDFMAKAFNAAARLERTAVNLLREVRKINGEPTKTTYPNKEMALKLAGDEKLSLTQIFERTLDLTEITVRVNYEQPIKKISKLISDISWTITYSGKYDAAKSAEMDNDLKSLPYLLLDSYSGKFLNKNASVLNASDAPEGVDTYTSPILMGNMAAVLFIPKDHQYLSNFGFKILPIEDDVSGTEIDREVAISKRPEMESLLKMVIHNCGQIRRFNKTLPELNRLNSEMKSTLNFINKKNEVWAGMSLSDDDSGDRARQRGELLRTIAIMAPKIAQGIHGKAFAFALNSSRTILRHVEYSIKAYA